MKHRIKLFGIITLVIVVVSMVAIIYLIPPPPLLQPISFSQAVYDDHDRLLRLTLSKDTKYRLFTPLDEISPVIIQATLLEEDQYFYWHLGVNPAAFCKALWQTYIKHSRRMGASTITMQVARMRYHIHSKSLTGKWLQIIRALQIEAHYSKHDILEAYLNLAPYGNNVEGVGAASLLYFNKPVSQLTLPEALTLAVIPQNPTKRLPDGNILKEKRDQLYLRWLQSHPKDRSMQALMSLPLQIHSVKAAPFYAPHFVNAILNKYPNDETSIHTTLNLNLQNTIRTTTQKYLSHQQSFGVNNAAVLLIDTDNMQVKALLGSADFFNKTISGEVDGTEAKRSPGSTLKPFIYALALDQGLIHPSTVLKDVPRSFGHYNPENFDYDFVGPIKARDALILSRNIPAVYLADQLKNPNLYQLLQQAEVGPLKAENYYGLALVLGGAEMSMQELGGLYAMLANGGVWQPLQFTPTDVNKRKHRLLSKEASFLVLDMLQETTLPGEHYGNQPVKNEWIAWKTGTSSGYRDAWTVGVMGHYVLVVWVGHFNNKSNHALVGKEMAAPLFFAIKNAIQPQINLHAKPINHLNLRKVDVCKASGMLPTRYCTDLESTWFIPGVSPIKTDTIYREVALDKNTHLRTCHFNENTRFAVYEFWPSDLLAIFRKAGIARRTPPPFSDDCKLSLANNIGLDPQIRSPESHAHFIVPSKNTDNIQIPLTAVVDADVSTIFWFANDVYLGQTTRDREFIWSASIGHYVLRAVDNFGRSDARDISITRG